MSKLIVRKNKKEETTPSFDGLSGLMGRRVEQDKEEETTPSFDGLGGLLGRIVNKGGVKVGSLEEIEITNPHKIDIEYDKELLETLGSLKEDDFVEDFFNESESDWDSDNTPKGQFDLVMGDKEDYDLDDIIRITNRLNDESPLVTFVDSENTLLNTISLKTLNYMVDMYGSLIRERFKSEFLDQGLSKYEENKRVKDILLDPEKFKTFDSVYELTFQLYFDRFKQEADNEINEGMIRLINEKGETNINDMMNFLYDRRGIEDTPITNRHRVSGFAMILSDESEEDVEAQKEKFIESLLDELTRLGYDFIDSIDSIIDGGNFVEFEPQEIIEGGDF